MSIINNAKQMANGVIKMMTPVKKPKKQEPKNFLQETPDEYGDRLLRRRTRRY